MSNPLHNICVYIEDEAHLKQARELLERFGHKVDHSYFFLSYEEFLNYLYLPFTFNSWILGENIHTKQQITLPELKKILEDGYSERV